MPPNSRPSTGVGDKIPCAILFKKCGCFDHQALMRQKLCPENKHVKRFSYKCQSTYFKYAHGPSETRRGLATYIERIIIATKNWKKYSILCFSTSALQQTYWTTSYQTPACVGVLYFPVKYLTLELMWLSPALFCPGGCAAVCFDSGTGTRPYNIYV